jgi:adenylate cyclase, class 2
MDTEIEAKFADIDISAVRKKLKSAKAVLEHPERFMRRKNFDYPDLRLQKIGGWVRVRDEGDKVTMSYKQLNERTLHGMKEISFIVEDFEKACGFLVSIGLEEKAYQETKREKWLFGEAEVVIDTWPWVPTFVEIEGPTEKEVRKTAEALDLDWLTALHGSVETIYQMHYDFTEEEIYNWEAITFTPPPSWLLAKKK